jgi:3-phenylpropionate/cinnamic acid dioxygenase small subunit
MEWDLRAEEVKAQEWAERLECLRAQIEYWIEHRNRQDCGSNSTVL